MKKKNFSFKQSKTNSGNQGIYLYPSDKTWKGNGERVAYSTLTVSHGQNKSHSKTIEDREKHNMWFLSISTNHYN